MTFAFYFNCTEKWTSSFLSIQYIVYKYMTFTFYFDCTEKVFSLAQEKNMHREKLKLQTHAERQNMS